MKDSTTTTNPIAALPAEIHPNWSDEAKIMLAKVYAWINADPAHSKAMMARISGLPDGTVAPILTGAYKSSPDRQLKQMLDAISMQSQRKARGLGTDQLMNTSVYTLGVVICNRARLHKKFGIFSGYVGTGKTTTLKRYTQDNPGTILIEADPSMTVQTLLADIAHEVGCPAAGSVSDKFRAIIAALKDSDRLLIVDEAETMMPKTLEYLRRIRDKANIGIVLAGTERLYAIIRREHGQFDQIRSRVVMWPELIKKISDKDAALIIRNRFPSIPDDALNALTTIAQGSARVLAEDLMSAVIDFAPQLIRQQKGSPEGTTDADFSVQDGSELDAGLITLIAERILGMRSS